MGNDIVNVPEIIRKDGGLTFGNPLSLQKSSLNEVIRKAIEEFFKFEPEEGKYYQMIGIKYRCSVEHGILNANILLCESSGKPETLLMSVLVSESKKLLVAIDYNFQLDEYTETANMEYINCLDEWNKFLLAVKLALV